MAFNLSELPSYVQGICGAITGVITVGGIVLAWRKKTKNKRLAKTKDNLGLPLLESKVDTIATNVNEVRTEMVHALEQLCDKMKDMNAAQDTGVAEKFSEITALIRDNEMERLKQIIFNYANYARQGAHISGEEYAHVRETVMRYERFGGDGAAHAEWEFFQNYYNKQKIQQNNS